LDGYKATIHHAANRKNAFDRRLLTKKPGQVTFKCGQLVQIYHSDLDFTFKMERKLLSKWSQLQRISKRLQNSYKLMNLDGSPIEGTFGSRCLRAFIPWEGTKLAEAQKELETQLEKEEVGRKERGEEDKNEEDKDAEEEDLEEDGECEEDEGEGDEEEEEEEEESAENEEDGLGVAQWQGCCFV